MSASLQHGLGRRARSAAPGARSLSSSPSPSPSRLPPSSYASPYANSRGRAANPRYRSASPFDPYPHYASSHNGSPALPAKYPGPDAPHLLPLGPPGGALALFLDLRLPISISMPAPEKAFVATPRRECAPLPLAYTIPGGRTDGPHGWRGGSPGEGGGGVRAASPGMMGGPFLNLTPRERSSGWGAGSVR
ncbi:hypothetical protein T484DRAFT_1880592, partial [Baffinella frigidus]